MMKHGKSAGFTLIEIMLAVALTGIIAAAALAPLLFTVKSLSEAQREWGRNTRDRFAADKIYRDVRSSIENPSFSPFKIIHKDGLSLQNDDRLLVWSASSAKEGMPVSLIVYKIVSAAALDSNKSGLYRWVLKSVPSQYEENSLSAGAVQRASAPIDIDTDTLKTEEGKLLLAGADGLSLSVWNGSEWVGEYSCELPPAMRLQISMNGKKFSYEEWFPKIQ